MITNELRRELDFKNMIIQHFKKFNRVGNRGLTIKSLNHLGSKSKVQKVLRELSKDSRPLGHAKIIKIRKGKYCLPKPLKWNCYTRYYQSINYYPLEFNYKVRCTPFV